MDGKRFAVLVGNGSFASAGEDAPRLPALRCPAADVAGLQKLLEQPERGAYAVKTLIDRPHNEIRRALYDCLKQAAPQDQVLIYYSGHGKLDEQGNLYLAGSDTDPGSLDPTALAASDVQKYVGDSRAAVRIVILDCCFSGAVERIFRHGTAKGEIAEQAGQALRAQAAQGVFYLTASTEVQTAEEKDQDRYSLLTKHIITGIESGAADANDDGEVRFSELCDFVQNGVRQEGAQRPLSFAFKASGDPLVALTGPRAPGRSARGDRASGLCDSSQESPAWSRCCARPGVHSLVRRRTLRRSRRCMLPATTRRRSWDCCIACRSGRRSRRNLIRRVNPRLRRTPPPAGRRARTRLAAPCWPLPPMQSERNGAGVGAPPSFHLPCVSFSRPEPFGFTSAPERPARGSPMRDL